MQTSSLGAWCQFQLPTSTVITSYSILFSSDRYNVTEWLLLASTDGSAWILLDHNSNYSVPSTVSEYNTYTVNNTTSYLYYRYVFLRGRQNGFGFINGIYLSDASSTIYPAAALATPTSDGYTLSSSSDLLVTTDFIQQPPGSGWNNVASQALPGYANKIGIRGLGPYDTYNGSTSTSYYAPPTVPSAPTNVAASYGNLSGTISFTPGSDGGGGSITNYQYSINDGLSYTDCNPVVTASPFVISGLTNGQNYTIRIRATNPLGNGLPSNAVYVYPRTIPGAPTNLVASSNGSGSVSIAFTPGSNGGMTIENYQYSLDCGVTFVPLNPVDVISPIIISGLANGQTYCIKLKAVNSEGGGIESSSVEYTASGPPTTPVIVSASDLYNGRIAVTATVNNQGSPFTNFSYSLNGGTSFTDFNPPQTSIPLIISGLEDRVNYNLVIKATTANGTTSSSNTLPLYYRCFLEGTKILCYDPVLNQEVERPVESLRTGDLVKTTMDGYKAIDTIGTNKIYNPANSMRSKNRLYKCSKENYPELNEDLVITGCHAVLVSDLSDEERRALIDIQGKVYVTEDYYRLIACVDKRAQPYEKEGLFNIWHFALENDNYYFNYGIYANGLKVETASKRMMKEMSGMDLL
jgi:hypothetical protein